MSDESSEASDTVDELESPQLAALADEGMLLVRASLRLTIKNAIVIAVLREGASWNEESLLEVMRGDIERMIAERRTGALRVEGLLVRARGRTGRAGHAEDFGRADVPSLERRLRVEGAFVARLQTMLTERAELLTTLYQARDAAMDEIQSHHLAARVRRGHLTSSAHDRERQIAALRWQLASLARPRK